jgi:glycosyltransferase involved in cell wall biosynthesis
VAARILCIDDSAWLWGAQQVLLRLAAPMREQGIDLVLAAPPDSALMAAWQSTGLPSVALKLPTPPSPRTESGQIRWGAVARMTLSSPRAIARIRQAARDTGVDAILANSHATQLDAAIAGRLSGLPVVLYLHEELPFALGRLLRSIAALLSKQVVGVSATVVDELRLGRKANSYVVHNGVNTTVFHPGEADAETKKSLGADPSELLIVAVTRLDPTKRIEDLVAAVAQLPAHPAWHLSVVGESTDFPGYAAQAKRQAEQFVPGKVTFTGRRSDVPDIMRAADVVVHTGIVEGLPLGLLEAQACGTPVVAYRVAGIPHLVVDGGTGSLAAEADVAGIANGLSRLLGSEDLRCGYGRAGACRVSAKFGHRQQAHRLAQLWALL